MSKVLAKIVISCYKYQWFYAIKFVYTGLNKDSIYTGLTV